MEIIDISISYRPLSYIRSSNIAIGHSPHGFPMVRLEPHFSVATLADVAWLPRMRRIKKWRFFMRSSFYGKTMGQPEWNIPRVEDFTEFMGVDRLLQVPSPNSPSSTSGLPQNRHLATDPLKDAVVVDLGVVCVKYQI